MSIDNEITPALALLAKGLQSDVPIVALLGQATGWVSSPDPVVEIALRKLGRSGTTWNDLLTREPTDPNFYQWLAERFERRIPSNALVTTMDMPFAAVFTSSIDPGVSNLLNTRGRESEPILLGTPLPLIVRSTRRPPVFYLFGRSGAGDPGLGPPFSRQALAQRRLQQASAMLMNMKESATALGLIVIDGYDPVADWLRAEDLLAAVSHAPRNGVIWFGRSPSFSDDNADAFGDLVGAGIIVRDNRSLGEAFSVLQALGEVPTPRAWSEPEIVSFGVDKSFVVPPQLRLVTEATTSIVDNSWLSFLPPFSSGLESAAFHSFHSANVGSRALIEGIRRGYAFERGFELQLRSRIDRALAQHHAEDGAIILHGQSGVGKTVAIGRIAIWARENAKVPVLISSGSRIPQPTDVAPFLEAVNKLGSLTLLLIDANTPTQRYDDLLSALKSGGHRVVLVGTSYRLESRGNRFIYAPSELSHKEQSELLALSSKFGAGPTRSYRAEESYALAKFYWSLPESRPGIADGLNREARFVESNLRAKTTKLRPQRHLGTLAAALVSVGYGIPAEPAFVDTEDEVDLRLESPAARVIDYIVAVSRLYKPVPINLLLRTVTSSYSGAPLQVVDIDILRDIFEDQDFFRWSRGGRDESELVVSSRLQIEAELVSNRRLGTPSAEAKKIVELIGSAHRAGSEDSEESHFVTGIVYALGPDGPERERYKDSYLDIARALTNLREQYGVRNARLMLQESTLRRAFIRTHERVASHEKEAILEEATRAVNDAIAAIDLLGTHRLYVAKRTREHLLTERAATYGFLATDSAQRDDANTVWASYRAARDAARLAASRVFSYQPLDISLWVPVRVLKESSHLNESQRAELQADIRATLDIVDPTTLSPDQAVLFNKQQTFAGEVLGDSAISEAAFAALDSMGSAVGYYLRARALAPTRPEFGEIATDKDLSAAVRSATYLSSVLPKISNDARPLQLLISMEWLKATGRWLFRGLRQPLPFSAESRERLLRAVALLREVDEPNLPPQFRYLDAVLRWLSGDIAASMKSWRTLAKDTEYVEARRVSNRHTIADSSGKPIVYSGLIVRAIGPNRWAVRVQGLDRDVDLQEGDFPGTEIALGRTVRNFAVSFSYRGTIADPFFNRMH